MATEVIGDRDERLDLVALDERNSERVLIEVRFWAGLTDNQPETYLSRLPQDGVHAVLLFVAPEQRLVTLWAEILRRAEACCELGADADIGGLKSVTVDGSPRRLMLTSWRTSLAAMSSRAGTDGDSSSAGGDRATGNGQRWTVDGGRQYGGRQNGETGNGGRATGNGKTGNGERATGNG